MIEGNTHPAAINVPAIGDYWAGQGGVYAGIMPDYVGSRPYHLIVSIDEALAVAWGGYGREEPKARSKSDGDANTQVLERCPHRHPAAHWAADYRKDGHDDFHLPAQLELEAAMTLLSDHFTPSDWYWSSTDHSATEAEGHNRNGVDFAQMFKTFEGRARAVRRIFVSDR
ncbi:hypothetical protein [Trinickia acidisoli]|uniref:hypothetical protein n=1 Tax=Trinickia acidisoli TaxID=2767482 RepID=UPI001A8EE924|nr:hypothetical protein [Trinickia acidisoli]